MMIGPTTKQVNSDSITVSCLISKTSLAQRNQRSYLNRGSSLILLQKTHLTITASLKEKIDGCYTRILSMVQIQSGRTVRGIA